jgi:hypothetical protein
VIAIAEVKAVAKFAQKKAAHGHTAGAPTLAHAPAAPEKGV